VIKPELNIRSRVAVPSEGIDLTVKARVPNSEVGHSDHLGKKQHQIVYWEGPVATSDEAALGYLEMTGYADPIKYVGR
jgi:predicted secreted hydrolase